MKFKPLKKKAQESRNDLFISYILCLMIVVALVGALYGFGIIGSVPDSGSLIEGSKITAAAVTDMPKEVNENNDTDNISSYSEDK